MRMIKCDVCGAMLNENKAYYEVNIVPKKIVSIPLSEGSFSVPGSLFADRRYETCDACYKKLLTVFDESAR